MWRKAAPHVVGWWMLAWGGFVFAYDNAHMAHASGILLSGLKFNAGLALLFGVAGAVLLWSPDNMRGWAIAGLALFAILEAERAITDPSAWYAVMEGCAAAVDFASIIGLVYSGRHLHEGSPAPDTLGHKLKQPEPTHAAGGPLDRP